MVDRLTSEERSRNMSRIRSKGTGPERAVRSLLHRLGFRFRLNRSDLPGSPDIVLPKYHAVIFVHGCFWHRHKGCNLAATPKSNTAFWEQKFRNNVARDEHACLELAQTGWKTLVIWECELRDKMTLEARLRAFLEKSHAGD